MKVRSVRRVRRFGAAAAVLLSTAVVASCAPPASLPEIGNQSPVDRSGYRILAGVEQLYVTGALEGDHITVSDGTAVVGSGTADRYGSLAIRELVQGRTYTVTDVDSGDARKVRILVESEHPAQSFYDSTTMHEGLNYIPMRDGITLAATVRPPIGLSLSDGPFPTVIEYSGYQVAGPGDPLVNKLASLVGLSTDPLSPTGETDVGSLLVRLAGFATVSVQLRGSGCSGGESDLFDKPTNLDGYDAIETVAAQKWVSGNTVGMVGISFSGFSQIGVAATHPPHLSAIAPMSFVGNLYDIAHPGGIFNDGFGSTWMAERVNAAKPAPDPVALPYANALVGTDAQCRDNQKLRLQTRDGNGLIKTHEFRDVLYQRRDFPGWMSQIKVPTFASLEFDDEETSSNAILAASKNLLGANDKVWLNLGSGHHRDSVTPDTITQYFEFLDIYVAHRAPEPKLLVNLLKDVVFGDGSATPPLPATLFQSYEQARASFEARPRVRLLLDLPKGAAEGMNTGARWDVSTSTFPVPGSTTSTWFFGPGGSLTTNAPSASSAVDYRPDAVSRRHDPGPAVVEHPEPFLWTPLAADASVGFVSQTLDHDVVAVGAAAANITLSSSAADTDLAVTISEVRPDGQEMLVGTGVQRVSRRHVDAAASTATQPAFTQDRDEPLAPGATVSVPVQVLPMAHVFRAGSKIRVTVAGVNGDRERWAFGSIDPADRSTTDSVHLGGVKPSSISFTIAPLGKAPAGLLPCPAAGKPCRTYAPSANGG